MQLGCSTRHGVLLLAAADTPKITTVVRVNTCQLPVLTCIAPGGRTYVCTPVAVPVASACASAALCTMLPSTPSTPGGGAPPPDVPYAPPYVPSREGRSSIRSQCVA